MDLSCTARGARAESPRPWWHRWAGWLPARPTRHPLPRADEPRGWTAADWWSLRGLSAQTLRDIGVPDWVHERRCDADCASWELLRR